MAGADRELPVSRSVRLGPSRAPAREARCGVGAALISVDGVSGTAAAAAGGAALAAVAKARRGGMSTWDASGAVPGSRRRRRRGWRAVGADPAAAVRGGSRLPAAMGDSSRARRGPLVVAAPYVDTAIALGGRPGLRRMADQPVRVRSRPHQRCYVYRSTKRKAVDGFIGFGCEQMRGKPAGLYAKTNHERRGDRAPEDRAAHYES